MKDSFFHAHKNTPIFLIFLTNSCLSASDFSKRKQEKKQYFIFFYLELNWKRKREQKLTKVSKMKKYEKDTRKSRRFG